MMEEKSRGPRWVAPSGLAAAGGRGQQVQESFNGDTRSWRVSGSVRPHEDRMSFRHRALRGFAAAMIAATAARCSESYKPGLGELMNFTQMRHAKLWFAGQERNWQLARYEWDELQEGFDDVVRFHPSHKDSPLPLSLLVPKIMTQPMGDVRDAIRAHDEQAFVAAYDELTAGCNSCHQAANFGFNVVKRPSGASWFSNQAFTVGH